MHVLRHRATWQDGTFAVAGFKKGISSEEKAARDARLLAQANEVGEQFQQRHGSTAELKHAGASRAGREAAAKASQLFAYALRQTQLS
jgi:hypothetical protein